MTETKRKVFSQADGTLAFEGRDTLYAIDTHEILGKTYVDLFLPFPALAHVLTLNTAIRLRDELDQAIARAGGKLKQPEIKK